jgi:hypothetical protein
VQDQRIEGIEIASLRVVDKSLFVHWNYFISFQELRRCGGTIITCGITFVDRLSAPI